MNSSKKIKTIISVHIGATGKKLLNALLDSSAFESIVAVGRHENHDHKENGKLKQIVVPDVMQVASYINKIKIRSNLHVYNIKTIKSQRMVFDLL